MLGFKKFFIIFFLISNLAFASDLYISEIMYNPQGNDEGREWVEIVNLSFSPLRIFGGRKGWRFYDGSNHLFEEAEIILNPNEVLLIVQNKQKFLSEYTYFNGKIIEVKNMSLKNEQGFISIFDESKNLKASREYYNICGGNGNGYSLIFLNDVCYEGEQKNGNPGFYPDERKIETETKEKTEENLEKSGSFQNKEKKNFLTVPEADKFSSASIANISNISEVTEEDFSCLVINEFLPNPQGSDENKEFVEIYNECNKKINLDGLILKIGRFKLKLSGEIKEKEFKVLRNSDYRFYLRNSGEEISLLKDNEIIYKISYSGKALENLSFSRNEEEWFWTLPTPGKMNEKESYQKNIFFDEEVKKEKNNKNPEEEINLNDFEKETLNRSKAEIYSSSSQTIPFFLALFFITFIVLVFSLLFKI